MKPSHFWRSYEDIKIKKVRENATWSLWDQWNKPQNAPVSYKHGERKADFSKKSSLWKEKNLFGDPEIC